MRGGRFADGKKEPQKGRTKKKTCLGRETCWAGEPDRARGILSYYEARKLDRKAYKRKSIAIIIKSLEKGEDRTEKKETIHRVDYAVWIASVARKGILSHFLEGVKKRTLRLCREARARTQETEGH